MTTKVLFRKIITSVAAISVVLANVLTSIFPLNNHTTADVTGELRTHFVPEGYVFNIWWVLYVLLLAFAVFQFVAGKKYEEKLSKIFPWFILLSVLSLVWLVLWHAEFFIPTIVIMLGLLYSLMKINVIVGAGKESDNSIFSLLLKVTFSIYFGWVTVSTFLTGVDIIWHALFSGLMLPGQISAAIMTALLSIVGAYMLIKKEDSLFAAVVVWALVGIWQNFPYSAIVNYTLLVTSIVLGLLLGGVLGLRLTRLLFRYI